MAEVVGLPQAVGGRPPARHVQRARSPASATSHGVLGGDRGGDGSETAATVSALDSLAGLAQRHVDEHGADHLDVAPAQVLDQVVELGQCG